MGAWIVLVVVIAGMVPLFVVIAIAVSQRQPWRLLRRAAVLMARIRPTAPEENMMSNQRDQGNGADS